MLGLGYQDTWGTATLPAALSAPQTQEPRPALLVFQKTKDHFLEVKMESSRQRFFHLMNDFAYIEVSALAPRVGG